MAIAVIIINIVLAIVCLVVAFGCWQLRRTLKGTVQALDVAERATHNVLGNAPEGVMTGQEGVAWLRQSMQEQGEQAGPAIARLQQTLAVLVWITNSWSRARKSALGGGSLGKLPPGKNGR
ncbi:MAG: hypothetical protein AAF889_01880 [Cyanobacteria bacterium P01_D01_bin.73]